MTNAQLSTELVSIDARLHQIGREMSDASDSGQCRLRCEVRTLTHRLRVLAK